MSYAEIQDHAIIGDLHTVALVSLDGTIDWFCYPRFDSPSVFGALLDDQKGGRFTIGPAGTHDTLRQHYWPDTNVLVTRFVSPDGVAEVSDFMPLSGGRDGHVGRLIRRVKVSRGTVRLRMTCEPAFDHARAAHDTDLRPWGALFRERPVCGGQGLTLALSSEAPLVRTARGGVEAEFVLSEGEDTAFMLTSVDAHATDPPPFSSSEAGEAFAATVAFWRKWLSRCTYTGRWSEMVYRSALALKLLTYEPTGAIVAAPTCSLPETLGGARNWDYRYTWIRDAAFTLYALMRIGFTAEAEAFMSWLDARCHEIEPDGSLQIVYGIDGRHQLPEITLDHLDGYRGARPVRVGNAAYAQLQLDIYGELMDSAYLHNKYGSPISYDTWTNLRRLVDWVCENWRRRDEGIWEVRGERQHFVYSKLMCWVALDRALRLADKRSFPADRARWLVERDRIYESIMQDGWSPERRAFVQAYGSKELDAANLIMPLVFFVSPTDPRMIATLEAIAKPPRLGGLVSDGLVYRYDHETGHDGLHGAEGTFNMCTFWLVEAMTRAGRTMPKYLERARLVFEHMLGYANHVGLYAEETGPRGEGLGNFPQAFTHLALISAAYNLDRALGGGPG